MSEIPITQEQQERRGNGRYDNDNLVDIDDVLNGNVPVEEAYKILEERKTDLERREKEFREQARRIAAKENDPLIDELDPSKPMTGFLGQIRAKWEFLEEIEGKTIEDVAHRYGAGTFALRIGSMNGRMFRFNISQALVWRVRKERDDPDDIYVPPKKEEITQPVQPSGKDETLELLKVLLLKQMDVKANNTTSGTELQAAYEKGVEFARQQSQIVITELNSRISQLVEEREELKNKVESLQIALGQLPEEEEEPETEPVPPPEPTLWEKAGQAIINGLQQTQQNQNQQQTAPPQIEHKPKPEKVLDVNNLIKQIILASFKKNDVMGAAAALKDVLDKNAFIKMAFTQNSKETVMDYLVNNFIPGADEPLKNHIGKLIDALKG